ncbi:Receptor-like serine/threonine-protein kinase At1g78530 [Geodia barretti]|uniref:Receptor-like serine/threonine-protein kinase At1g78530 n=1 Tax=Geodia barretti TaxID=519541 RepID=A0AA35XMU9_GEOBA|nr:Receptor-like serine/threonine-protein kinase At1g78530 [Geodia barretti]
MEFGYKNIHLMKDKVVGTGAYGTVFHARIDNLVCAAKSLHPVLFRDNDPSTAGLHKKFLSECQIMSRLRHPNIVQYLGRTTDPQTQLPILLMELMDCNLTKFLEGEEPFPYHLQVNFSHDVAKAIAFIHSNQIMHRDVNSNNVLLLGRVQAKLGDFGMSSLLQDRKSRLTQCPGALAYMAPEAQSYMYSEMLDIFSMGVLLVHMMTRMYPNPTDAHRDVGFEKGRRLLVAVPELDRRREHISMINSSHPLLPIANNCLEDKAAQRPSANHLCQQIETLKTAPTYQESLKPRAQERRGEEKSSQRSEQEIEALRVKVENQQLEHQKLGSTVARGAVQVYTATGSAARKKKTNSSTNSSVRDCCEKAAERAFCKSRGQFKTRGDCCTVREQSTTPTGPGWSNRDWPRLEVMGNTQLCCTHHLMSRMPRKNGMQCLPFAQSLWLS